MAEIRVEQKRRSLAWLWLLLALALIAAGVWYFYFNSGAVAGPNTGVLGGPDAPVAELTPPTPAASAPGVPTARDA